MSSELMDELKRIQKLSENPEEYQNGFDTAIIEVLNYIAIRRRAYKANGIIAKYEAMDLLYNDILVKFDDSR
jgi:hypothetical protein